MPQEELRDRERVLVLVKALPHVGDKHGETVCCAGVTAEGRWRRLFPVSFRSLDKEKQFRRWDWIEYRWRKPTQDQRPESRHVQENSIAVLHSLPPKERHSFLNRIVRNTVTEAAEAGETLTLIRPLNSRFSWEPKSADQLSKQAAEYKVAASQLSFFASSAKPLEPCPYEFTFSYRTSDGKSHTATCDDWETSAMYYRFEKKSGAESALQQMDETFNVKFPSAGMAFAMGTHSRYPKTWLLVGVIRLDNENQHSLKM